MGTAFNDQLVVRCRQILSTYKFRAGCTKVSARCTKIDASLNILAAQKSDIVSYGMALSLQGVGAATGAIIALALKELYEENPQARNDPLDEGTILQAQQGKVM